VTVYYGVYIRDSIQGGGGPKTSKRLSNYQNVVLKPANEIYSEN